MFSLIIEPLNLQITYYTYTACISHICCDLGFPGDYYCDSETLLFNRLPQKEGVLKSPVFIFLFFFILFLYVCYCELGSKREPIWFILFLYERACFKDGPIFLNFEIGSVEPD